MRFLEIGVSAESALKKILGHGLCDSLKIERLKSASLLLPDQDVKRVWIRWQWSVKQKRPGLRAILGIESK